MVQEKIVTCRARVRVHNQQMTIAAMAIAQRKTLGLRSLTCRHAFPILELAKNDLASLPGSVLRCNVTKGTVVPFVAALVVLHGRLSHLHSLAATMSQKPSLIKST